MDNSYKYLGICEKTQDNDEQDKKGLRLHHQLGLSELRRKKEEANFKEEDRKRAMETWTHPSEGFAASQKEKL